MGEQATKFQVGGAVATCEFGMFYTLTGMMGIVGSSPTSQHTRTATCPETYDCICSTPDCGVTGTTFCCPGRSKAYLANGIHLQTTLATWHSTRARSRALAAAR